MKLLQLTYFLHTLYLPMIFSSLDGMENASQPPQSILYAVPSRIYQKNILFPKDMTHLAKAWETLIQKSYNSKYPQKNEIHVNANIITLQPLFQALKKAHEKGVQVTLLIGNKALTYNKSNIFNEIPTFVYKPPFNSEITDNHAKYILSKIDDEVAYSYGSSNMSINGVYQNNEINMVCSGDKENYTELLNSFKTLLKKSKPYGRHDNDNDDEPRSPLLTGIKTIHKTPEKPTVYTSEQYSLHKIVFNRLAEEKFSKGDQVVISSFTFNHQELTDLLCKLLDKGIEIKIYLDKDPLSHEKNTEQIKTLLNKNAKIYICIKSNKRTVHHPKLVLINRTIIEDVKEVEKNNNTQTKQKKYSIISTLNMLPSKEYNILKIETAEKTFDDIYQITKQYEQNTEFSLLTTNNIDEITNKIKKIKATTPQKNKKRKLPTKNDLDNENNKKPAACKRLKF